MATGTTTIHGFSVEDIKSWESVKAEYESFLDKKDMNYKKISMNIVNQLFDYAELSVEKRQLINDKCDEFVMNILKQNFK